MSPPSGRNSNHICHPRPFHLCLFYSWWFCGNNCCYTMYWCILQYHLWLLHLRVSVKERLSGIKVQNRIEKNKESLSQYSMLIFYYFKGPVTLNLFDNLLIPLSHYVQAVHPMVVGIRQNIPVLQLPSDSRTCDTVAKHPVPCMCYWSFQMFKISTSEFGTVGMRRWTFSYGIKRSGPRFI